MKKILGVFLSVLVVLVSCTNNEGPETPAGEAPVLPPELSMAPDMSMFDDQGSEGNREIQVGNWAYAAINVGVYSAILYQHLVIPVTAFKATIGTDAMYNESEGLWVWEKAFEISGKGSYSIRLTAEVLEEDVFWMGYISGEGVSNFVWFTGESNKNGEEGSWNLYEGPESASVWLSNRWEIDREAESGFTKFTVEKEGEHMGSSIRYAVNTDEYFDRMVTIVNAAEENTIYVDWRSEEKNGRVKSLAHFGDELFHCWDGSLQNVDCE
ncbi:hypothetical protein [Echinicola marina]|uniref:hypothetical protein n=1 Tax=Echinicola marina TaxID=2859768 RepID=UPI001CF6742C|nr:hypothetical protein [Echinicola marina]